MPTSACGENCQSPPAKKPPRRPWLPLLKLGGGNPHAAADRAAEIDACPVEGLRAAGKRLVGRHRTQATEAIAEAGADCVRRRLHRNAGAADGLASELAVAILELG